ncbi:MAG: DnaJ domain-containing protein [Bacteroidota bacterium]
MREYYLEILELSPNATEREIKSAYRRLSKQYHPDRNPAADAKEKFIEITKAYDYLTNFEPTAYSEVIEPEVSAKEQWRAQAREQIRQRKREEAAARDALIRQLLSYFNLAAVVILAFNGLLAIDFLLPRKAHQQQSLKVEKVFEYSRNRQVYSYDKLRFEDFSLQINKGLIKPDAFFDEATVLATRIFQKPQAALLTANGQTTRYELAFGIYQVFGLLIPVMFLLLVLYQYIVKTLDGKLSLAILMLVILIIQILLFVMV